MAESRFKFRKLDTIGAADAVDDHSRLRKCFVDTGALTALRDCSDPRRLVVGNTGSGKTAILLQLAEEEERVLRVQPETLALPYITNSTILAFVTSLGVKLDIFFRLLWRHVLVVEILRSHFGIYTEEAKRSFLDRVMAHFKDQRHSKALKYLESWGRSFWEDTEYRIKEVTHTLEKELEGAIEAKVGPLSGSTHATKKFTESEKQDVIQRTQHVVNQVQIRELSQVLELLDFILSDAQRRYFVTIDGLDENWIDDRLRFALIRALIETAKDFRCVKNAKVVVALRRDLLDRVFERTRDAGFQEEKYQSLYLDLRWSKTELVRLLDARVTELVQCQYTNQKVTHRDLMPTVVRGAIDEDISDFLIDRTMLRPRDVIQFFNLCIEQAVDRPSMTVEMIRNAEGEYSRRRLRALADEWSQVYPNLLGCISLLKNRERVFAFDELADQECEELCLSLGCVAVQLSDSLVESAVLVANGQGSVDVFRKNVVEAFYRVGIVGLKLEHHEGFSWASDGRRTISTAEILPGTRLKVHAAFLRALGIRP